MDIELVYFSKDPRQAKARAFLHEFVVGRGILAKIVESDRPVKSPTVTVNGRSLSDLRSNPRSDGARMYPGVNEIAQIVEQQAWGL